MKTQSFISQLKVEVENICHDMAWDFQNEKHRGMGFENWCFDLFNQTYNESENRLEDCILRQDDFNVDICFPSKEFQEVYFIQSKYKKISNSPPIDCNEVESFFLHYEYFAGHKIYDRKVIKNPRVDVLFNEFKVYLNERFKIYFIFITTEKSSEKDQAIQSSFQNKYQNENVSFEIWDPSRLAQEYVKLKSVDESYPDDISFTLGENKFLYVDGPEQHLTFVLPGTSIQQTYIQHRHSLFNWNIRSFLGRKGQVNTGMSETLENTPDAFYYFNNGISALCESFNFDKKNRKLVIKKLQIVNGAQTVGALGQAKSDLTGTQVLVKLTAIKNAQREKGMAASIIRANNTQNSLRVPDFRSNDPIQIWIEDRFKNTKSRGKLGNIVYGRKRPYPRQSAGKYILKMIDLGKIRYAWHGEPRLAISSPNKLFLNSEDGGVYEKAFGEDGNLVDIWSDESFNETVLAINCFEYLTEKLKIAETETFEIKIGDQEQTIQYAQLTRLRLYGLALMRIYADDHLFRLPEIDRADLYALKQKFTQFCDRSSKLILMSLKRTYKRVIENKEGAAFSLPRDSVIWDQIRENFAEYIEMDAQLKE